MCGCSRLLAGVESKLSTLQIWSLDGCEYSFVQNGVFLVSNIFVVKSRKIFTSL